jgi:hypothetical protein
MKMKKGLFNSVPTDARTSSSVGYPKAQTLTGPEMATSVYKIHP